MIGIVVVSHSRPLAEAAIALASEMVPAGRRPRLLQAAGLDPTLGTDVATLGTDATAIAAAIADADSGDGVLVLLDLGSAVLSAEMALDFGDPDANVRLSPAPLVEGLVAAVVTAATGADLATCDAEARRGLDAKLAHLASDVPDAGVAVKGGPASAPSRASQAAPRSADLPAPQIWSAGTPAGRETHGSSVGTPAGRETHGSSAGTPAGRGIREAEQVVFTTVIDLPAGLHARPAAAVVAALADLDVEGVTRNATRPELGDCEAVSAMGLLALGVQQGDTLEITLTGPQADQAAVSLEALAASHFGE